MCFCMPGHPASRAPSPGRVSLSSVKGIVAYYTVIGAMAKPRKISGKRRVDTCEEEPSISLSPAIAAGIQDQTVDLHAEIERLRREIETLKKREEERERFEESLRDTVERYRKLIQSTSDGILLNDEQGVILEWNTGMEEISGIPRDEAIGRTLPKIALRLAPDRKKPEEIGEWIRSSIDDMNRKAISSSKNPFIEIAICRPDATRRTIQVKNFDFAQNGRILYGGIVRDITERKQIEHSLAESEDTFRNLIQSTRDGIILNDEQGVILEWNTGMEEIFGIPRSDSVGRTLLEVASQCIPKDTDAEGIRNWLYSIIDELDNNAATSSHTPLVEVSVRRPDGSTRNIEAKNFDFTVQGRRFYGGIVRDLTERRQVEDALLQSEEELRNLIDSSDDGIIITDESGRITKWNKGAELITGLASRDVVGVPAWEIQSRSATEEWAGPDPLTRYRTMWDQVFHDAADHHFKCLFDGQIKTPHGEVRYIQQSVFRIPTRSGFRIGAIIRDITERKRFDDAILESEEKYRTLVDMSPDIIVIHQDGNIVYANPAIEKLLRTANPEDLIGMNVFDLIHPDFHPVVQQNIRDDLQGKLTPTTEIQIIRGDGTLVTFEGKGKKISYNGNPAVLVVIRDITDRKNAELQLREYAGNLKRSVDDLELFAYIATHDLQEPIRGIVAYAQLLLNQCNEARSPKTEKYLKIIENSGLRLNALVNDLREYSRVRSLAKPLEPVDLATVLSNALQNLQLVIKETGASITHDQLPVVLADPTQVTQVFQNLIDNAIKFRREGVAPVIHISVAPKEKMWQFSLKDNGIGIPREYYGKIFILFERLHQRDTYPGTGLGLALCTRIIERHGGRIWVDSEVGKGSTFSFTLPAG